MKLESIYNLAVEKPDRLQHINEAKELLNRLKQSHKELYDDVSLSGVR